MLCHKARQDLLAPQDPQVIQDLLEAPDQQARPALRQLYLLVQPQQAQPRLLTAVRLAPQCLTSRSLKALLARLDLLARPVQLVAPDLLDLPDLLV